MGYFGSVYQKRMIEAKRIDSEEYAYISFETTLEMDAPGHWTGTFYTCKDSFVLRKKITIGHHSLVQGLQYFI